MTNTAKRGGGGLLVLVLLAACTSSAPPPTATDAPAVADPAVAAMAARPLVATRHGECRMACRHIDLSEVRHVMATGRLDPARTRTDGACPSHAVEGTTPDGQAARVVLAACETETRIVTVIDLDTDWECTCD